MIPAPSLQGCAIVQLQILSLVKRTDFQPLRDGLYLVLEEGLEARLMVEKLGFVERLSIYLDRHHIPNVTCDFFVFVCLGI